MAALASSSCAVRGSRIRPAGSKGRPESAPPLRALDSGRRLRRTQQSIRFRQVASKKLAYDNSELSAGYPRTAGAYRWSRRCSAPLASLDGRNSADCGVRSLPLESVHVITQTGSRAAPFEHDRAVSEARPRYVLKPDPHSSHSIILRWLGDGHGRRVLDVGAADGLLSGKLTERGWRVTGIEETLRWLRRVLTL